MHVEAEVPAGPVDSHHGVRGPNKDPGRSLLGRRFKLFGAIAFTLPVLAAGLPGAAQTTTTSQAQSTQAPTTAATPTTVTTQGSTTPTTQATTVTTASTTATGGTSATTTATTAPSPSATVAATPTTAAGKQVVDAAKSAKAREVDAANAKLSELSQALAALEGDVKAQTAALEIATRRFNEALAAADASNEDVAALEAQVVELEYGLSDQAIRSFKGDAVDVSVIAVGMDPNLALRKQAMLAKATQSDIDFVNALAGIREDLVARRAEADEALALAEQSRITGEEELAALEEDRAAQATLAAAAEQRLDHLLSERAALASLGADLDTGLDAAEAQTLVKQLANAPAAPPSGRTTAPATVSEGDIRLAGNGIRVHVSIVDAVSRLLADAAADGVSLAGGGFRDSAGQIATRRNNCGTSQYAIYEMPSSRCRPPTARPGRSMHEKGMAIDFTHNGRLIRSRSGAGWNWLNANANKYGLYNLPSEPWHWSTNGR